MTLPKDELFVILIVNAKDCNYQPFNLLFSQCLEKIEVSIVINNFGYFLLT